VPRTSFADAAATVAAKDRRLAVLMERRGRFRLARPTIDHFGALAESILYQQLAGAAAAAIHRRFVALFDGQLTPQAVLALPEGQLRSVGLSGSKATSIRDLAQKVADGTVPLERIEKLTDDEIVERLSVVRGIGRWTAEMFLIFQLRRLDVWPVDDYGVRQGWSLIHRLPDLLKPKELEAKGEKFRPYRTVVAWYCWEAVHEARAKPKPAGRSTRA
jgi:DNA-3-methyladenine glycosylase II